MNERKGTTAISVGIVLMFFISMAISYATALMSKFAEFFPNVNPGSYSYVMSMAFLGVMIGALVAGALVPRVMGYKPASIIGTIIFCVFGLLPVWVHDSFGMVIFFRFMTGFGAGMLSPLANGLVTAFYEGDTRAKLLSVGTAAAQIGRIRDVYRFVLYVKDPAYETLVRCKDLLEADLAGLAAAGAAPPVTVQFDFDPESPY
jgi:MFS family permease